MTDLPKLMTVPQAARALRIGRSTAYDLAHAWLDSEGAEGLPVVRIGRSLRVPVAALDRWFTSVAFGDIEPVRRVAYGDVETPAQESPEPAEPAQLSLFRSSSTPPVAGQSSSSRPSSSAAARSRSGRNAE
jgi:excisionase family DNA binding protein